MLDPTTLIESGGLLLIALVIFGESGMFIGFFFPGDTLLLAAGVFAASGNISLPLIILVASAAAIVGDNTGYIIGKFVGPRLFDKAKDDSIIFRTEYINKAHSFFQKYGSKAMLLAHFVPVVRTFAPPIAGAAKMNHAKFALFDAIGDTAWATAITLLGYYVGSKIPGIDHYVLILVGAVIVLSFGPVVYHVIRRKLRKRARRQKSHPKNPD